MIRIQTEVAIGLFPYLFALARLACDHVARKPLGHPLYWSALAGNVAVALYQLERSSQLSGFKALDAWIGVLFCVVAAYVQVGGREVVRGVRVLIGSAGPLPVR